MLSPGRGGLSALDDYPIHQIAEPLRFVATSDRNFFDRYYFNLFDTSGEVFMVLGLGVYPNMGVMDGFVSIRIDDEYRVVRASKELGDSREDTTIGPIRVEVLEGLKRLRFVLEPNEWDLALDVTWESVSTPYLETHHQLHRDANGRVVFDGRRFLQNGRWQGQLTYKDRIIKIEPETWWGMRDRSWGIRPIGEAEPEKAGSGAMVPGDWYWNLAVPEFAEYSIAYVIEERSGQRLMEDAVRIPHDGGEIVSLGRPEHELEFISGTRDVKRATIRMTEPDGRPIVMEVEPLLGSHVLVGTGYGGEDHWRHGKPQGPLAVEGVSYDLSDPKVHASMYGVVDTAARFTIGDQVGYGMWEYLVKGVNERYGFATAEDMAP